MSQFLSNFTADSIANAAAHLVAGDLVAFPTETVYGLGADACNFSAVEKIYSVKGRPNDHPLIIHIAAKDRISDWAIEIPDYAIALAQDYWPGPMTLVLKRSELAGDFVTGGQETVGIRVPNHIVALALLEEFEKAGGKGVAAPSANRFGQVSPTTATAVIEELGRYLGVDDLVINGGDCVIGIESTIIDCTRKVPKVLRPGAITTEMIIRTTGLASTSTVEKSSPRVSGSFESHYSPAARVVLDQIALAGQGFIGMSDLVTAAGVLRLASPETPEEFAQVLYSAFRAGDELRLETIVVIQPIGDGIEIAIRDRLRRAANFRQIT